MNDPLYALHDYDKSKPGMFLVDPKDAKRLNSQGYGIHWMPQVFKDNVRKLENLERIRYWIADLDNGPKETMLRRIAQLPIDPTLVVETKRGYHVYWRAKDATLEKYATIEKGIAEFLCADGSLITPTHTLRFPGFYHMKDPKNPFLVKFVFARPKNEYSEKVMLRVFKPKPEDTPKHKMPISAQITAQEEMKKENWHKYLHTDRIVAGNRNNEFSRIAYHLAQGGASYDDVLRTLLDINQTNNIGLDYREIEGIVKGKFK
jgi:hypothetical protein